MIVSGQILFMVGASVLALLGVLSYRDAGVVIFAAGIAAEVGELVWRQCRYRRAVQGL